VSVAFGRGSVGAGIRPVQCRGASRLHGRGVRWIVEELAEARSYVPTVGGSVTGLSFKVPLVCGHQYLADGCLPDFNSGFTRLDAVLPRIQSNLTRITSTRADATVDLRLR
jgi:hypothetical protein